MIFISWSIYWQRPTNISWFSTEELQLQVRYRVWIGGSISISQWISFGCEWVPCISYWLRCVSTVILPLVFRTVRWNIWISSCSFAACSFCVSSSDAFLIVSVYFQSTSPIPWWTEMSNAVTQVECVFKQFTWAVDFTVDVLIYTGESRRLSYLFRFSVFCLTWSSSVWSVDLSSSLFLSLYCRPLGTVRAKLDTRFIDWQK